ncbi:hypothetical protein ANN_21289 [Periplaneta americana]|uniref:Uncharacterized protein n=1 Tax=Periplaneta americana TaxID=6978 RepID=A0ABQ8SG43_PERAM|nr:hypothetical protein ANN_21289 [Periplaneta americana]
MPCTYQTSGFNVPNYVSMKALAITMVCILFAEVEQHVIRQYLVEEEPPRPKHRLFYRGHSLRYKKKIDDQRENRVRVCHDLKSEAQNDPNFLKRIVTWDESWCYGYDPESKQASSQWKTPNSP